ncbi:RICIN domain-containing protein [Sorangium sp. So ce834]
MRIIARRSGKCLDIVGGSTAARAPVIQWTCHGSRTSCSLPARTP